MTISPCISICKTDPKTGFCYGCGRTNNEKKIWKEEGFLEQIYRIQEKQIEKPGVIV